MIENIRLGVAIGLVLTVLLAGLAIKLGLV